MRVEWTDEFDLSLSRVADEAAAGGNKPTGGWTYSGRAVVVTVLGGGKKRIGDAFYRSVGPRADAALDTRRRQQDEEDERQKEDQGDGEEGDSEGAERLR